MLKIEYYSLPVNSEVNRVQDIVSKRTHARRHNTTVAASHTKTTQFTFEKI